MIPKKTDRAMAHNVHTVRFAQQHYRQCLVSHNQYSVNESARHYIQCDPPREETLFEKICASAAFIFCVTLVMFMG
jgi:hypothetical protein